MQGFVNLNKPAGWTSHDCVAKVRKLLRTKRVGHGGTLDPAATGVLPIAVGKATRLLQYLPEGKAYRATVRFGVTTTTDDLEGDVLSQQPSPGLTLEAIAALLPQFVGTIDQIPPRYSAIQVDGKRLYDRARAGEIFEVPARTVEVRHIQVLDWRSQAYPEVDLEIACGPGTYIRSIARDLGAAVGTGAALAQLQRTESCGFRLDHSLTLEELAADLEGDRFQPTEPNEALRHLPAIQLLESLVPLWLNGRRIPLDELGCLNQGETAEPYVRVQDPAGVFLGIAAIAPDAEPALLIPKLVFN